MEDKNYVNNLIPLILDEISEAIFVIEGNQTITYQNKVALDLFGESIGGNIFDLLIFEKSAILVDAIFENKSVEMEAKIFLTKKG
ncbi:MAG: PAS domain-containing protein, partial [Fervidobacterium sp.]